MITITAHQLAQLTNGTVVGDEQAVVTGCAQVDSRLIQPGDLFVAVAGENQDGHEFAEAAAQAGAGVILAQRPLPGHGTVVVVENTVAALGKIARWNVDELRKRGLVSVGITGTVGKTTVKDLVAALLSTVGETVAPVRSFNNTIGVPLTALRADEGTQYLIVEMGTDLPGYIASLTEIVPLDLAAVLKVAPGHLAGFGGSLEAVAQEKVSILAGIDGDGPAVLNAYDGRIAALAPTDRSVLWFSEEQAGPLAVEAARVEADGTLSLTLADGADKYPIRVGIYGAHHLSNVAAAITIAHSLGLAPGQIARVLGEYQAVSPHRMAVTKGRGITLIDDAYNANPESMRAALQALATIGKGGRTIAVLGPMYELGEETIAAHDAVGRLAVRLNISKVLAVGQEAYAIHTGAYQEGSWDSESEAMADRHEAREWLMANAQDGDVVLVKASNGSGLYNLADELVEWMSA